VREGNNSPVWYIKGEQEQGSVFQVDMFEAVDLYNKNVWLKILGDDASYLMTDTDGNDIYTCKLDLPLDSSYNYYFTYQNGSDANANIIEEQAPETCANSEGYRAIYCRSFLC